MESKLTEDQEFEDFVNQIAQDMEDHGLTVANAKVAWVSGMASAFQIRLGPKKRRKK